MTKHPGQIEVDALNKQLEANGFPASLAEFCAAQADRYGEQIALDFFQDGIQISYTELHQRSNRIAANLLAAGYRKGAHIAVMLPNSPAAVLLWFAIMKIGACFSTGEHRLSRQRAGLHFESIRRAGADHRGRVPSSIQ